MTDPGTGSGDRFSLVLRPVRAGSGFEEALEQILQVLRLGLVPYGQRLPSERELAERLRISRVTLREVLKVLQDQGLVESRRGRYGGTFVRYRAGELTAGVAGAAGPGAEGWSDRQRVLLTAVDELHRDGDLGDATWQALRRHLDERSAIELVMLAGHYEMLATFIAALRIPLVLVARHGHGRGVVHQPGLLAMAPRRTSPRGLECLRQHRPAAGRSHCRQPRTPATLYPRACQW